MFNPLDLPYTENPLAQREFITAYPNGFTIWEALCAWVSQVNDMVGNINTWNAYLDSFVETFDTKLQAEVLELLTLWRTNGTLAQLLGDIFTDYNNRLKQQAVSVRDYGAVGDGVTDDTAAFQAALAALSGVAAISTVYVPAGTYIVKATLALKTRQRMVGAGAGMSILKVGTPFTGTKVVGLFDTEAHQVEAADFGIEGTGRDAADNISGIDFTNVFTVIPNDLEVCNRLKNIRVRNMSGYGIKAVGRGGDVFDTIDIYRTKLTALYVNKWDSHFSNVSAGQSYAKGIHLDNQTGSCMFHNCKAWGNDTGWYIDGVENTMTNCTAQESTNYGVLFALNGKRNVFQGNIDGSGFNSTEPTAAALYVNGDQNIIDLAITNRLMAVYGGDCMAYGLWIIGKYNNIRATIDGATTAINPATDYANNLINLDSPTGALRHYGNRKTFVKKDVTSFANIMDSIVSGIKVGGMCLLTIHDATDRTKFWTGIANYSQGNYFTLNMLANNTITVAAINNFGSITVTGSSGTVHMTALAISV